MQYDIIYFLSLDCSLWMIKSSHLYSAQFYSFFQIRLLKHFSIQVECFHFYSATCVFGIFSSHGCRNKHSIFWYVLSLNFPHHHIFPSQNSFKGSYSKWVVLVGSSKEHLILSRCFSIVSLIKCFLSISWLIEKNVYMISRELLR